MSQKIRCANPNCRRLFVPDLRVKNHRYCSRKECRRLRKRRWQSEKMKTDPDYRKNQQESHQCWIEQNRDYYRRYRTKNPPVRNTQPSPAKTPRPKAPGSISCKDGPDISSILPDSGYFPTSCKKGLDGLPAFSRFRVLGKGEHSP